MSLRFASQIAIAASFTFLFVVWIAYPWVFGDTPFVLDGTNAFVNCLSQHQFHACGFTGKLNYWGLMSPIGDWPLHQHVPDLISVELGAQSHPTRTRVLELLNVAGVGASLLLARIVLVRVGQAFWFPAFALVVLSSPILWWARTTAGEVFASGLLVCLVAAAVLPAPAVLVAVAAFGASLTKETSYPFVAALCFLGLVLARRRTGKPIRTHVICGAVGVALAFAATSFFNIVRYGSVLNTNTLNPQLHTLGVWRKLEYAAGVIVAPNGGILVFWPAATVLLLACLAPLASRRRSDVWPSVVLLVSLAGLAIGFASWWTPFGWFAYGPRLILPWLPPLVLIGLVAYGEALRPKLRRLLRPWWALIAVFAVVLAFTLPSIGEMWRPHEIDAFFAQAPKPCTFPWLEGAAQWHTCQQRLMWSERPMGLYTARGVLTPSGFATTLVIALGLVGCLYLLRGDVPREVVRE